MSNVNSTRYAKMLPLTEAEENSLVESVRQAQVAMIFSRAMALMDEAKRLDVVIKMNMITTKELETFGSQSSCVVSSDGPGKVYVHPDPSHIRSI